MAKSTLAVIPILLLSIFICGCGLTRGSAKELIDSNLESQLLDKVTYPITIGLTQRCPEARDPIYRFLLGKQLLKITQPSDIELTDKGKRFFQSQGERPYAQVNKAGCDTEQINVVLGHRGGADITGIVMDAGGMRATVEYGREVALTNIGREFQAFRNTFSPEERGAWAATAGIFHIPDSVGVLNPSERYTARLAKFDDGWRVVSIK